MDEQDIRIQKLVEACERIQLQTEQLLLSVTPPRKLQSKYLNILHLMKQDRSKQLR